MLLRSVHCSKEPSHVSNTERMRVIVIHLVTQHKLVEIEVIYLNKMLLL